MIKRLILAMVIVIGLGSFFVNSSENPPPPVDAALALPAIRACTNSELVQIMDAVDTINADLDELSEAIDALDLKDTRARAVALHRNWYDASPDIPYCAQGVHTRLLVDRMIEVMVLTGITMSYGDVTLGTAYADLIDATAQDLVTYGQILISYY